MSKKDDGKKRNDTLSKAAEALLEVLLDPRYKRLPVGKKWSKAGISKSRYYELMSDQKFVDRYHAESRKLLQAGIGPAINSLMEQAARGSIQHQKIMFEMTGMYNPNLKVEVEERVVIVGDIDDEEYEEDEE